MKAFRMLAVVATIAMLAAPAWADWDPSTPFTKWVQEPDLSPEGLDVNATMELQSGGLPPLIVLADDFECVTPGPITDIHIWGSWLNDMLPQRQELQPPFGLVADPAYVQFHLSIHSDIPADPAAGIMYSRPGPELWSHNFLPGEFAVRVEEAGLQEGWLDPISGIYEPVGDTVCWQYNFDIPVDEAFRQVGTPDQPMIYWLDVNAVPQDDTGVNPLFGWKTSIQHWNDDAVYGPVDIVNWPHPPEWFELRYPDGHPFHPESIDLAFAITTIPEPSTFILLAMGVFGVLALMRKHN